MTQDAGYGGWQPGQGGPQGGGFGPPPPGQGTPGPGGPQAPLPGAQPYPPQAQPGPYVPGQPGPQSPPPQGQFHPPAGPQWQAPPVPGPVGGGPGGGGRGQAAAIAIGAVAFIAAVATVIVLVVNGSGDDEESADDESGETHELVLPVTSGDFRIAHQAQTNGQLSEDSLASLGVNGSESVTGIYYAGIAPEEALSLTSLAQLGDREVSTLAVVGAWGTVEDPERAALGLLQSSSGAQNGQPGGGLTLIGEPQDMQPSGLDEAVMKCQYGEAIDPATRELARVPACAWADDHTVGYTVLQRQNASGNLEVSLEVAADHTAALRTASLVESSTSAAN